MKKGFFFVIVCLFFVNILLAKSVQSKDLLLISRLQNYEMVSHITFQDKLFSSSNSFFINQSKKFVDNETGFLNLWSEAFSFYESETKKKARWKNRLEKYFRDTEYTKFIRAKQQGYITIINQQREELLGKLHHINKKLVIKNRDIATVNISNEELNKIVGKVNSLVLVEVIPQFIESLLVPLIISLVGLLFGIFLAGKTKGIIFFIVLIFSIWQSFKCRNKLEHQIIKSFAIRKNTHLNILADLQKNSTEYYLELTKKTQ